MTPLATSESFDASVFQIYAHIVTRSGLYENAISTYNRILERTDRREEKLSVLRILLIIENCVNGSSARLLELWAQFGELNNPENEDEEAEYLQLFLLVSSFDGEISDQYVTNYQTRLNDFSERFPNSTQLKLLTIDEDSPEEVFEQLKKVTGVTDKQAVARANLEKQITSGKIRTPFRLNAQILPVPDYIYLWELSKIAGSKDKYLCLDVGKNSVASTSLIDQSSYKVLVDETALIVMHDLGILDDVLRSLDNVFVAKEIILELHNLVSSFPAGGYKEKGKEILSVLGTYSYKLQQPTLGYEYPISNPIVYIEQLAQCLQENGYLLLSG